MDIPGRVGGRQLSAVDLSRPLYDARGWIQAIAVTTLVIGTISLPLVCAVVLRGQWAQSPHIVTTSLAIWQGVLLLSSCDAIHAAHTQNNDFALAVALIRLRKWFMLTGCTIIALIVLQGAVFLLERQMNDGNLF